ncbi:hypothetical protein BJ970_004373 [Saccharopolyspora phatthalungensis]|uniref:Transposase IS701-like DDE domain-containing protein n=1 Tax=Saccharopolyspora phatthalungensis TaxID=664693 RepID=A0A840QE44_9PSEU|nr:transposase [Saccharopolyspora phatthalungensis]MBB5156839.1 hypothetical protein [Saccharopolyspora phatthalungensis]
MRWCGGGWRARAVQVVSPEALVLDDTGHLKDGNASPGRARQYTGTAGKVTNCQIAVSVHAVTDTCSAALNWRLFLPQSWDDECAIGAEAERIAARRRRCGIPRIRGIARNGGRRWRCSTNSPAGADSAGGGR